MTLPALSRLCSAAAGILWSLAVFDERPAVSFRVALFLMVAAMHLVLSRKLD
ncbi:MULTISPECIES: hypothetical protein [unclassified Mesorhizobium]|uniref:hypothetical protein n=1 Tax=unclassified Mesorhizobium TaxID=325217 RepID=UPI0015E413EC|nr:MULTISPECIES: hypothetical protein [unclassified Mesorhizobium]